MSEETNTAQIVLYQSEGANVPVEVSYMQGTFWMPQRRIAELFGKDKSTISRHLKNILGRVSWTGIQLLQILQQLPPTGRRTGRPSTP